ADTDWPEIASLYGVLSRLWPSPVVELNRAVAVGMATGPASGLAIVDRVRSGGVLNGYPLLAAVRGDLLARLNRAAEARAEFEQAASLSSNARERAVFLGRAADAAAQTDGPSEQSPG
ncbi:MAG: RNA polymerase subunit sigma-24, partial [Pseudonocardiaceae bacterium]